MSEPWGLLRLAQSGSPAEARKASAALVAQLSPKAYALAFRMMRSHAAAEDVLQESFIRLWRSQAQDTGEASLSTYLHRIVTRESLRALGQQNRLDYLDDEALTQVADAQQFNTAGAEVNWGAALQDRQQLERALMLMPDRQRAALVLWAYEDRDVAEIANTLSLTENAAHQLLHRARQTLKQILLET